MSTVSNIYCTRNEIVFHSFQCLDISPLKIKVQFNNLYFLSDHQFDRLLLNNFQEYLVFIIMILSNIMMEPKYNKACDSVTIFISYI